METPQSVQNKMIEMRILELRMMSPGVPSENIVDAATAEVSRSLSLLGRALTSHNLTIDYRVRGERDEPPLAMLSDVVAMAGPNIPDRQELEDDGGRAVPPEDDCCATGACDSPKAMAAAPDRQELEDRLRTIADIIDGQPSQGTDMANFKRRLNRVIR